MALKSLFIFDVVTKQFVDDLKSYDERVEDILNKMDSLQKRKRAENSLIEDAIIDDTFEACRSENNSDAKAPLRIGEGS